ncbi:MAG: hypothetical protein NVS2B14_17910 [Chamaesiphon sp.]
MTLNFKVPSMACSACANTITDAVKKIDSSAQVEADLKTKTVSIKTQEPETVIKKVISAAGYPVN